MPLSRKRSTTSARLEESVDFVTFAIFVYFVYDLLTSLSFQNNWNCVHEPLSQKHAMIVSGGDHMQAVLFIGLFHDS